MRRSLRSASGEGHLAKTNEFAVPLAKPVKPQVKRMVTKATAGTGCGPTREMEDDLKARGYRCVGGADEAGRGPLAGPVVAAVCVLPDVHVDGLEGLNDSKQLGEKERERLYAVLTSTAGVKWAVHIVDHTGIDRINILQASLLAMSESAAQLASDDLHYLLVDGNKLPANLSVPAEAVVKGDGKCMCIAAASVIAKVTRDRIMMQYHLQYPNYGFNQHKGYAVPAHYKAIHAHGPCAIHRRSFQPIRGITGWTREGGEGSAEDDTAENEKAGVKAGRKAVKAVKAVKDGVKIDKDGVKIDKDGVKIAKAVKTQKSAAASAAAAEADTEQAGVKIDKDGVKIAKDGMKATKAAKAAKTRKSAAASAAAAEEADVEQTGNEEAAVKTDKAAKTWKSAAASAAAVEEADVEQTGNKEAAVKTGKAAKTRKSAAASAAAAEVADVEQTGNEEAAVKTAKAVKRRKGDVASAAAAEEADVEQTGNKEAAVKTGKAAKTRKSATASAAAAEEADVEQTGNEEAAVKTAKAVKADEGPAVEPKRRRMTAKVEATNTTEASVVATKRRRVAA